jgi:hypothetical protein
VACEAADSIPWLTDPNDDDQHHQNHRYSFPITNGFTGQDSPVVLQQIFTNLHAHINSGMNCTEVVLCNIHRYAYFLCKVIISITNFQAMERVLSWTPLGKYRWDFGVSQRWRYRLWSSGLWNRVVWQVLTNVSEEPTVFILRVQLRWKQQAAKSIGKFLKNHTCHNLEAHSMNENLHWTYRSMILLWKFFRTFPYKTQVLQLCISITVQQPSVGPWPLFQFLNPIHSR